MEKIILKRRFFCENCLNLASFPFCLGQTCLVSVSVDDVRDVINVSAADIPDAKVLKMIKRAEVTLELELGKEIDYDDCMDAEKEFITVLAAVMPFVI